MFKAEPKNWAKTDMDLVTAFVEKALKDVDDNIDILYHDLSTIAAKSIDKNLSEVHISDIRFQGNLAFILKTGFIFQSDDYLSFSLPIIAQWMAAEAIRRKIINIEDILCDKSRTNRWLYALSISFSQMTFEESLNYFSIIAKTMPGIASRIIRDGIRFGQEKSSSSAYECGRKLQECMTIWINALGPLSKYIAPVDSTNLLPLVIGVEDCYIAFSWTKEKTNDFVKTMSIHELISTQKEYHCRAIPAQSTWPWIITFEYLSSNLKNIIEHHTIIPDTGQIKQEFIWNTALYIGEKNDLYEGEIHFETLNQYRSIDCNYHTNKTIKALASTFNKMNVNTKLFYEMIDKNISEGIYSIIPPYPVSDKKPPSGSWIWQYYSAERYLEKVKFVYSSALTEYNSIVETAFPVLKDCLKLTQLMPCKLVGKLSFHEDSESYSDSPHLILYFEALPYNEFSKVDIQIKESTTNNIELLSQIRKKNMNLRPEFILHSIATIKLQGLDIITSTPVTDLVYEWLESELKTLGWIN